MPMSLSLMLSTTSLSSVSTPTSAITNLTIMGSSPKLDATNDYSDATVRTGVDGNGWVAKVTVPYQAGQTFDPTKISLTVTDPGYDGTGTTTVTRTVTGTEVLRRVNTTATVSSGVSITARQNSNDGITTTVYFALSDDIYSGSTVTGTVSSGYYGPSTAGRIASVTNSSSKAYEKPIFAFLNDQHEVQSGAFTVEGVAYHRRGQSGRMVARVEYIPVDTTGNTGATTTVSSTSASTLQTQGQNVDVYAGTVAISALNQSELCFVNAKVYPWLGDSTAVLDINTHGFGNTGNVSTAQPHTRLRFVCDKGGTYGGAHAAVQIGAVGGTVQTSRAAATGTPYPTLQGALAALQTYNNTNKSRNNHSGSTVWMMETTPGSGATHTVGSSSATASGSGLTDIRVDTDATGSVKAQLNALATGVTSMLRFFVNIDQVATNGTFDGGNSTAGSTVLICAGNTINTGGIGFPFNYQCGHTRLRNVTITGLSNAGASPFFFSTGRTQVASALGVVATDASADWRVLPFSLIGCSFKRGMIQDNIAGNRDSGDGKVIANNLLRDCRAGQSNTLNAVNYTQLAIVQNVIERANGASEPALYLSGDNSTNALDGLVFAFNTIPGTDSTGRLNIGYTDVAGAASIAKPGGVLIGNLLYEYNCKTDTFTTNTTVQNRVGNFRRRYTVGDAYNIILKGSASGTAPDPDGPTFLAERWPDANYNVGTGNVTWTSNLSGAAAAGSGTYTLTGSSNSAYNAIPSGKAMLARDLNGVARKNDGTGAAGAYERTL